MASHLKGKDQLKARLKAIPKAFKPIGRVWADETAKAARPKVPWKTGRLRRSIRRRNATQKRATVVAHYTAYFIDKGTKAHDITARKSPFLVFKGRKGTVFARSVHQRGLRARPFRQRSAEEGLANTPMAGYMIREWNRAGAGVRVKS